MERHKFSIVIPVEFAPVDGVQGWQLASAAKDAVQNAVNRYLAKSILKAVTDVGGGSHVIDMAEYRENTDDSAIQNGRDALRRAYNEDIRGIADEFMKLAKLGEFDDGEAADEWLHQTIDGCQRVIITAQAKEALLCSSNEDAYVDDFGTDGMIKDGNIDWSALAFCTVRADVMEQLDAYSVDPSEPDTWGVNCSKLSREACVELLTDVSIECKDDESVETLRTAVEGNIADGTILASDVREKLNA